ncbi:hypothetical protein CDLVIII_4775 [Clostridium sp. DL-VIII]|uniref:hypothetical protein n=1 Tax=Clostridium sp. DL-VIII TaxID=641107 RepID=UPI00023B0330|nr:hypothetical protein [Clostridium sp. DL-VIII]EHJ01269.1 hypothetical protein CDLVIII_4775 [Clostridium sp. DL-VIII]
MVKIKILKDKAGIKMKTSGIGYGVMDHIDMDGTMKAITGIIFMEMVKWLQNL